MKKLFCVALCLMLCICSTAVFAEGKLEVVQESSCYVEGFWNYGYVFGKVVNSGDAPICVNSGVMEMYDENGAVVVSSDWPQTYVTYLQPGEYTYVTMCESLEEGAAVPVSYKMTLTSTEDTSQAALWLPVETKLELDVGDGFWKYDYMYATVTNNTQEPLYNVEVVFALLDAEGNILTIDSKMLYNELAIMPGSSLIVRREISSSFMDIFEAKGTLPVSVDALAYVLVDND